MISLKNSKQGGVIIHFSEELVDFAKSVFPALSARALGVAEIPQNEALAQVVAQPTKSLEDVKNAVESARQPVLRLNQAGPSKDKPDFSTFIKHYFKNDDPKQMLAFRRVYAELYSRYNLRLSEEKRRMERERAEKPRGQKGEQIYKSHVVRALGFSEEAMQIAKEVVKGI
jgi:hypothetical protein